LLRLEDGVHPGDARADELLTKMAITSQLAKSAPWLAGSLEAVDHELDKSTRLRRGHIASYPTSSALDLH
jgi:hypothetical protein